MVKKDKKFNLFGVGKISLAIATMFTPIILNSNNASASPGKTNPTFKITSSGSGGLVKYMQKYTKSSSGSGSGGYVSLVSGKSSLGSTATPVSPLQARDKMLQDIIKDTGKDPSSPTSPTSVLTSLRNQQRGDTKSNGLGGINPLDPNDRHVRRALEVETEFNFDTGTHGDLTSGSTRSLIRMLADIGRDRERDLNHQTGMKD